MRRAIRGPGRQPGGASTDGGRYFFLSYGRTPRLPGEHRGAPDSLVSAFFDDLAASVGRAARVDRRAAGFCDLQIRPGEDWIARVERELATCRVLVPMYSERYFESDVCGREVSAFMRRVERAADDGRAQEIPIVPVLWDPPPGSWPWVPAPLVHPDDAAIDARYSSGGLYGLHQLTNPDVDDPEAQEDYETILDTISTRIVRLARSVHLPVDVPLHLEREDNAFERPATRPVALHFVAPTTTRRPLGRDPLPYGDSALDWNPYKAESDASLAQHAADLARKLRYTPTVTSFESSASAVLDDDLPTGPAVLVIDPWALDDHRWRTQLAEFDRRRRPWVGIAVAWNPDDPQTAEARDRLARQLDDTLTRRFKNRRLALHLDAGIASTLGDFVTALSTVITEAAIQYLHTPAATAPSIESDHPGGT